MEAEAAAWGGGGRRGSPRRIVPPGRTAAARARGHAAPDSARSGPGPRPLGPPGRPLGATLRSAPNGTQWCHSVVATQWLPLSGGTQWWPQALRNRNGQWMRDTRQWTHAHLKAQNPPRQSLPAGSTRRSRRRGAAGSTRSSSVGRAALEDMEETEEQRRRVVCCAICPCVLYSALCLFVMCVSLSAASAVCVVCTLRRGAALEEHCWRRQRRRRSSVGTHRPCPGGPPQSRLPRRDR